MKRIALLIAILVIAQIFFPGCNSTTPHSDLVVAKYGNSKILMSEFEKAFTKNISQSKAITDTVAQLDSFMTLYINFKMKLSDAAARGYDNNASLQSEYIDYKKKVGVSYILEKQLIDPNMHKIYDLRKNEYRLAHLMIRPDSTGDEAARKKITAILDTIKKLNNFEEMTAKYSSDNFSKTMGGDIYYFTPGTFLPEFEDAYIKTAEGQVYPEIIKTRYGYHILKVNKIQARIPEIKASHILITFQNDAGEADSVTARLRADTVYNKLLAAPDDFAKLAAEYSKDQNSKDNGGDLGFFSRRMMVKEFDEAAFQLPVNEVSKPIRTMYGYHIIKVTDRKTLVPFETDKETIKTNYKQYRYQGDYDALVSSLKKNFNYTQNDSLLAEIAKVSGDTLKNPGEAHKTEWYPKYADKEVYKVGGNSITVDSLFTFVNASSEFNAKQVSLAMLNDAVKKQSADITLETAALNLETKVPDFASLMDEYKNGIYIFKLQEETIWNKLNADSAALAGYYEKNPNKFTWPNRVEFSEIFAKSDSVINLCKDSLSKGVDFNDLAERYSERAGMKEKKGKFLLQDVESSDLSKEAAKLTKEGEVSAPFKNSDGISIFKLDKKEAARSKTFEEAKPEVSGAFQEEETKRLEKDYLKYLENTFSPKVYHENLAKAFKN